MPKAPEERTIIDVIIDHEKQLIGLDRQIKELEKTVNNLINKEKLNDNQKKS